MFTLKCEFCGYEQNVKKKIDKYTYYELTHCKHLWCPCNKCKEQHPRPRNFTNDEVMHGWVFGEWDCVLNIEDATYVYPHQNYGIWSKIVIPTIEDCKSLVKARLLRDLGLQILQEQGEN